MRKLLVSIAILALATPLTAHAADLPASPYKADTYAPPAFSWTGFYVGANVGAGWGTKEWDATSDQAGALSQLFTPNTVTATHTVDGFLGGGQLGFNYQMGWAVWGAEAQADWSNLGGFGSCFGNAPSLIIFPAPPPIQLGQTLVSGRCSSDVRSLGTVAARFGATVDRSMVFVKGGWAWANDKFSLQQSTAPTAANVSWNYGDISDWRGGLMVGAGVEYAFSPNWSAKVEYDYLALGTKSYTFAGTLVGPAGSLPNGPVSYSTDITQNIHLIKFGINYRFGWGGPIVANY